MSKNIYSKEYWKQEAKKFTDKSKVLQLPWERKRDEDIPRPSSNNSEGHIYHIESGYYIPTSLGKNDYVHIYSSNNREPRLLKYDGKTVDISTLENLAITAYGETYGDNGIKNQNEAFAITSTIVNKHQIQKQRDSNRDLNATIVEMRNHLAYYNYGTDAQASGLFRKTKRKERNNYPYMRVVLAGAINALLGGRDKSNQAIGWHGDDLTQEGTLAYNFFYKAGWGYSLEKHDIWNQGSYKHPEDGYVWLTTAAYTKQLVFYMINSIHAEKEGLLLDGYPK